MPFSSSAFRGLLRVTRVAFTRYLMKKFVTRKYFVSNLNIRSDIETASRKTSSGIYTLSAWPVYLRELMYILTTPINPTNS